MIVRDLKRALLLLVPLLALLLISASLWHSGPASLGSLLLGHDGVARVRPGAPMASRPHRKPTLTANKTHMEIYSSSTPDGRYFDIRFGVDVFNPNIVPHPKLNNTWFVVGQMYGDWAGVERKKGAVYESHEVGCIAQFLNGELMCIDFVKGLPIAHTKGGLCEGDIAYINFGAGPHDARVFMGPESPFITYGSNSDFTCFGQWVQDFRHLVDWEYVLMTNTDFPTGTEMQRPAPYSAMEKNYFIFWDRDGDMHVHYDTWPKRGFSSLERNGTVGPNMANKTTKADEKCLAKYMPKLPKEHESIHQATNSLKITLCNRSDPKCEPHDGNTYILTIIQHKTYYSYHSEYEPYVVLFQQRAPFELHAISKRPLWISGRKRGEGRRTDMLYVTSANWRDRGVNYHGYLDDVVMLGFGVEDKHAGGMDVLAADLVSEMGLCAEEEDEFEEVEERR